MCFTLPALTALLYATIEAEPATPYAQTSSCPGLAAVMQVLVVLFTQVTIADFRNIFARSFPNMFNDTCQNTKNCIWHIMQHIYHDGIFTWFLQIPCCILYNNSYSSSPRMH